MCIEYEETLGDAVRVVEGRETELEIDQGGARRIRSPLDRMAGAGLCHEVTRSPPHFTLQLFSLLWVI